jgi:hypothetical protein
MRVLVSDTSVLIDLERGRLLETAFGLPWEFAVPDLLYKRELRDHNGPALQRLGLRIEALDEAGVRLALAYQARSPALSLPDTFAITLAKVHGWVLLAGDAALRRLAADEEIEHHGVLWVLDQLLHQRQADAQILQTALTEIAAHPRCRLPAREINERLDHYARLIIGAR